MFRTKSFFTVVFILILFLLSFPEISRALDPENCLLCHKYKRIRAYDEDKVLRNYYVDPELYNNSLHRNVPCTDCHIDINKVPHDPIVKPVDCAQVCHIKGQFGSSTFSHQSIVDNYQQSIHSIKPDDPPERAALKPDCKYCHLNDLFQVPDTQIPEKALERCMNCHKETGISNTFIHMSHRLRQKTTRSHMDVVELCASCHENPDFINALGLTGLKSEAVHSYKETIHYRIIQFGAEKSADCIACHASSKIHDIRPKEDPASMINEQNIYRTCQQQDCHPGASEHMASIDTHLTSQKKENPEIHYLELIMEGVMFFTLFLLFTLMGMETYGRLKNKDARFFRWRRVPKPFDKKSDSNPDNKQDSPGSQNLGTIPNLHRYVKFSSGGDYPRYSIHILLTHIIMALAFFFATLTGIPLYFHNALWAQSFVELCGGINVTRYVHRINAIIFTLDIAYHFLILSLSTLYKLKKGTFEYRRTMLPAFKDLKDAYDDFRYFLGITSSRPLMEKFMYKQKLHYYAMIWGCSVLTLSGVCLLFPAYMVEIIPFPNVSFNLLRLLHADESILALLVIVFWHLYNVHLAPGRFPNQWTWLTGKISRDHQIEEHYLEYQRQVKEGVADCEEDKLIGEDK